MKTQIILMSIILIPLFAKSQVKVESQILIDTTILQRDKVKKSIYSYTLKTKLNNKNLVFLKNYVVTVVPDLKKCSLPFSEFEVDFKPTRLSEIDEETRFFIILYPNNKLDAPREINLVVKFESELDPDLEKIKNTSSISEFIIRIGINQQDNLKQYNYLAYVGTNFDLVDGIRANNLFFATNFYQIPKKKNNENKNYGFGFNSTIYGNRAITMTEEFGRKPYTKGFVIVPGKDSVTKIEEEGLLVESKVVDNLGASLSPLIDLFNLGKDNRIIKIFWSPQIEFIRKRYTTTREYKDIKEIGRTKEYSSAPYTIELTPPIKKDSYDKYDWNISPLSAFLIHENENISIRFQCMVGLRMRYSSSRLISPRGSIDRGFDSQYRFIASAKAWITEPKSGITLQAEFSNIMFKDREPFFNITLSKAISFENLGSIFSPIV
ncbi:MAG: hypothetical protein KF870_00005, partial [Leadbetterella sp.]|nr:hypothetical protein [Leadbetterella sp.]